MLDRVVDDAEEVVVTRHGREAAVIISLREYESLKETAYLMASPANARRQNQAVEELRNDGGDARPDRLRRQLRRGTGSVKVQFAGRGWEDYPTWQRDRQMLKRVNALIQDIRRNDPQGIGKPEQLRGNWAGFWSRRIDQEHRLAYRITDDTVQIAQCRYHFE